MDENRSGLYFNYWPAFADMMLALVLILFLIIAVQVAISLSPNYELIGITEKQNALVKSLSSSYNARFEFVDQNTAYIVTPQGEDTIRIYREAALQRITFSDRILFAPDSIEIKESGKRALAAFAEALKVNLGNIRRIQIEGHADKNPSVRFPSNLELAAARAINVFKFLYEAEGIDPAVHVMSITSFGEYMPVGRSLEDRDYSWSRIDQVDNATAELRRKNRRIEILLLYRISSPRTAARSRQ